MSNPRRGTSHPLTSRASARAARGVKTTAAYPARRVIGWIEADGAKRSGLSALTYATICNYAVDAALAVALAGTLFFSATTGESRQSVALYLLVTIAPFAVLAPLIGPALDRVHRGRRLALSLTFCLRVLLAMWLLTAFHSWVLYPAALGLLVLSKAFGVLKSAVTPRVSPAEIDLVQVNARLTILGHAIGSGVWGGLAAAAAYVTSSMEALWLVVVACLAGMYACVFIPETAESVDEHFPDGTSSLPATAVVVTDLTATGAPSSVVSSAGVITADTPFDPAGQGSGAEPSVPAATPRSAGFTGWRFITGGVALPYLARVALWAVGACRFGTGFLTIFLAFAAKATPGLSAMEQLNTLAAAGVGGGIGTFAGNFLGARIPLGRPRTVVLTASGAAVASAIVAAVWPQLLTATLATTVISLASALCKVCLDACIQDGVPDGQRSGVFGRSETLAQLAWVFGGTLAILVPSVLGTGFVWLSVMVSLFYLRAVMVCARLTVRDLAAAGRGV